MSEKKKKMSREEQIEDIQNKMDAAREAKMALIKARQSAKPKEEEDSRVKFQEFWAMNRKSYGKGKELEPILWAHLKAIGCDKPEKFAEGIANFGIKKV